MSSLSGDTSSSFSSGKSSQSAQIPLGTSRRAHHQTDFSNFFIRAASVDIFEIVLDQVILFHEELGYHRLQFLQARELVQKTCSEQLNRVWFVTFCHFWCFLKTFGFLRLSRQFLSDWWLSRAPRFFITETSPPKENFLSSCSVDKAPFIVKICEYQIRRHVFVDEKREGKPRGRRDRLERDEKDLQNQVTATRGVLSLSRFPQPEVGRSRLRCEAHDSTRWTILHGQNHIHSLFAGKVRTSTAIKIDVSTPKNDPSTAISHSHFFPFPQWSPKCDKNFSFAALTREWWFLESANDPRLCLRVHRDFPGIRIGPEPTTDRFIAVMYDDKEGVVPGNALVVDPKKQFRPLSKYGNAVCSV
jgi:hypothetical protein